MTEWLSSWLLERPWRMAIVLIALQFGLICLWSWRRTRRTGRMVWIGFLLIPGLVFVSAVVVTPREQIVFLCHNLARYVDEGNVAAIVGHLAEDFTADAMDRLQFEEQVHHLLERHPIDQVHLSGFEVSFGTSEQAEAMFDAACYVRGDVLITDRVRTRWRVSFRRDAGTWRVTSVEPVATPFSPLRPFRNRY